LDWRQSIELYSGLRRLGKTCTLLLYPDEGHTMYKNQENQLDLTRRIKAWFDRYLKPDLALKNGAINHFSEGSTEVDRDKK